MQQLKSSPAWRCVLPALVFTLLWGCGGDNASSSSTDASIDSASSSDVAKGPLKATCKGCHTDQELLLATVEPVKEPDSEASDSGET